MSSDKRTIENDLNNLKYFYFLFLTLKQKHGVLPGKGLEGDGTENKHKVLVSCRNTLQGHCVAAEVLEFLNKTVGTGLCIYGLTSFFPTSWPSFASQASDQGWMWWGENARGRWRSVLHSMLCQSVPLETIHTQSSQICGGTVYVCTHDLFCWFPLPTPWASGNWRHRSVLVYTVPHIYGCKNFPVTMLQNIPISKVHVTSCA